MDSNVDEQIAGRKWLLRSAALAKHNRLSMAEWMEMESVLNCCKQAQIPESMLEHVAYWVWKPIKR